MRKRYVNPESIFFPKPMIKVLSREKNFCNALITYFAVISKLSIRC